MTWQNNYLNQDQPKRPSKGHSDGLEGMSKLVKFSKIFNRRKSIEKELSHEIEKFFRTQQNKIKKIIETGAKFNKKPASKNMRHSFKILIQDADADFLVADDKFGVVPFKENRFLLREAFYHVILRLLTHSRARLKLERAYTEVSADVEAEVDCQVELLTNHTLFPKEFTLSNLLETALYSKLHPQKKASTATSNFKIFKLIKYQKNGLLATKMQKKLTGLNLVNKGTNLVVGHKDCWNHLMIHVRIADNKARIEVDLAHNGFQFNVLEFSRSVFVVINNEIIYNSCEFFKQHFLNIEVSRL